MLGLQYFTFAEIWSPVFMVWTIVIAIFYLLATGAWRRLFAQSEPVRNGKKMLFLSGLATYYIAQGGPVSLLGHLTFSFHMIEMALSYLIAPPLMLLGIPGWLIRPIFHIRFVGKAVRFLTRPLLGVVAFNALFSFYHMPNIMDFVMTHYTVHEIYYDVLLFTSCMMWWPLVAPLPELEQLSDLRKMAYLFLAGVLLTPACALIIFADHPLYASFSDPNTWAKAMGYCVSGNAAAILAQFGGPRMFLLLSPLDDQQMGGVVMKLMQEIMYGSILAVIFFRWFRKENSGSKIDKMPGNDEPESLSAEYALTKPGMQKS
ncbi:MAG TPA: cytochrome c oxidase assembly factor CtaG [Bacilli bacterium]